MELTDPAPLLALHAAANLSKLGSYHIVNKGYEHLANLCTAPDKPCFVLQHRKEVMDWFAAIHNAAPDLLAELQSLRARVAELEDDSEALEDGTRAYMDLIAERDRLRAELEAATQNLQFANETSRLALDQRDRLRAERDAARDEIAGLREALLECGPYIDRWDKSLAGTDDEDGKRMAVYHADMCRAALARTSDQHRKAIIRQWLEKRADEVGPERADLEPWLRAEADGLERGE